MGRAAGEGVHLWSNLSPSRDLLTATHPNRHRQDEQLTQPGTGHYVVLSHNEGLAIRYSYHTARDWPLRSLITQ